MNSASGDRGCCGRYGFTTASQGAGCVALVGNRAAAWEGCCWAPVIKDELDSWPPAKRTRLEVTLLPLAGSAVAGVDAESSMAECKGNKFVQGWKY